jgi:hypothetical protein
VTLVVGLVSGSKILFAADSISVTSDYDQECIKQSKIWKRDGILFGGSDSFRAMQIAQYAWTIPKRKARQDLMSYLVNDLVHSLRRAHEAHGFEPTKTPSKEGDSVGFQLLIGIQRRIFVLQDDYAVIENTDNFAAIGSGAVYARAALAALEAPEIPTLTPKQKIIIALTSAEKLCAGVRKPFRYAEI